MKPRLFFKVTAFFVLFSANILHGDWEWENDLAIAKPTTKGYEATLFFQNKGKSDVTVTGLKFPCTCTVYHFTATTAKPGGTGTLTVLIEPEGDEHMGRNFDVIATGSTSTQSHQITIRIEKSELGSH